MSSIGKIARRTFLFGTLAVAGGDGCGFLEGLDDLCRVGCGILAPFLDTELG